MENLKNKSPNFWNSCAFTTATTALLFVVAGCSTSTNQGGILSTQQNVAPATSLQPAPLTPVQQGVLQPVTAPQAQGTDVAGIPADPSVADANAAAQNEANAQPVTHKSVARTWNAQVAGANCMVILPFTKWSGGYRAAQRGCSSTDIGRLSAWDVKGKQVVLFDSSGSPVATLYKTGPTRFDGTTSTGKKIFLYGDA